MGLFDFLKKKSAKKRLEQLYLSKGYDRVPVLPNDKECARILEEASSFPASLVPKVNLTYLEGSYEMLPGHIVMLWWLDNPRTNKDKRPLYFLYEYGLDFETELLFLQKRHLLDGEQLTAEGEELIDRYSAVIRKHKARKTYSGDEIIYHYEDAEQVKGINHFVTTGNFVEDQFIGRSFEKAGDLINAELAYLSAINICLKEGDFLPPNPFMRLAIIYRKQKNFKKEESILIQALDNFKQPTNQVFRDRLHKIRNRKSR